MTLIHRPNSRFFNPSKFALARVALAVANTPKDPGAHRNSARHKAYNRLAREGFISTPRLMVGATVAGAVERLKAMRPSKTTIREFALAELSNMTVKALRTMCKAASLTGYGKLRKAELVAALG